MLITFTTVAGPDLRGGPVGPSPPTNRGSPPNPSYFIYGSIDTHIVVYV